MGLRIYVYYRAQATLPLIQGTSVLFGYSSPLSLSSSAGISCEASKMNASKVAGLIAVSTLFIEKFSLSALPCKLMRRSSLSKLFFLK